MRVVLALALDGIHRVGARDNLAGGGAQRVQVGLSSLRSDKHFREGLAVDVDGDAVGVLGNLHLSAKRQGCRKKEANSQFHVSQYTTNGAPVAMAPLTRISDFECAPPR